MKNLVRLFVATCVISLCGWAQESQTQIPESYVALLRSDIHAKKTQVINQILALTDDEAKKFWPLQRSYESDLSKLGDQQFDVIRDYANNWNNLSDATAKDLGKRLLVYQKKRVDLQTKYFDRISKEMSPMIAAKFFQVELQLEEIIDLKIASSLPLIQSHQTESTEANGIGWPQSTSK